MAEGGGEVVHAASATRVVLTNHVAKSNQSKQDKCCVHVCYIIATLFERWGRVIPEGSDAMPPMAVFTDGRVWIQEGGEVGGAEGGSLVALSLNCCCMVQFDGASIVLKPFGDLHMNAYLVYVVFLSSRKEHLCLSDLSSQNSRVAKLTQLHRQLHQCFQYLPLFSHPDRTPLDTPTFGCPTILSFPPDANPPYYTSPYPSIPGIRWLGWTRL